MNVPSSPDQPESPPAAPPAAPVVDAPAPATPTTATPGQWPVWVRYADIAILLFLVATAFLVASHTARNHEQWLHYASGRALLKGEYSFGTDPFSHATEGRTWVNHSWLYGVISYLLYNADTSGFIVIVIKAVFFAISFGIVNLIRKSNQVAWPWLVVTTLAILASTPHSGLRPIIATGFFLAVTLFVLLGTNWKTYAVLNTAVLGVVFWLWASCDSWFILGPISVLLVLAGEFVQKTFFRNPADTGEEASAIPLASLVRALLIGVVACSLTPHHVRVWELPYELGLRLPPEASKDTQLNLLLLSPRDAKDFWENAAFGRNFNGLAYLVLLVGGGLSLAVFFNRIRISYVFLWLAFAGVSLLHWRLILLFSIAAVPLLSSSFAEAIDRIQLGSLDRPRTKMLLLLSGLGRILGFPAAVLLALSAYPGWLHRNISNPTLVPRVAWAVEADAGLKRSAELLNSWRESGQLPDNYNGLFANLELANHIAWYAPKVKVFLNGRYSHHAPEFANLVAARRLLLRRDKLIEQREADEFHDLCKKYNIAYIAYCGTSTPPFPVEVAPVLQLTTPVGGYTLWHIDGRMAVLGDRTSQVAQSSPAQFNALAFDPVKMAFNPQLAESVPAPAEGQLKPTIEPTFLDDFIREPAKMPAVESLDAEIWLFLSTAAAQMDLQSRAIAAGAIANPALSSQVVDASFKIPDTASAYRILAVRAAYRSIAANPDDFQGYLLLARAIEPGRFSLFGLSAEVQQKIQRSGYRQFLDRAPPITQIAPGSSLANSIIDASLQLTEQYQPSNAMNNGRPVAMMPEASAEAFRRFQVAWSRFSLPQLDQKEGEARSKAVQQQLNRLEEMSAPYNESYLQAIGNKTDPSEQIDAALQRGLVLRAASIHAEQWKDVRPEATLRMVQAYMQLGKLNDADFHLRAIEDGLTQSRSEGKGGQQLQAMSQAVGQLRAELLQLRGDFAKAGELMDRIPMQQLPPQIKEFVQSAVKRPTAEEFQKYIQLPPQYGAVLGATAGLTTGGLNQQFVGAWRSQTSFFLARGMIHLLEGKIDQAEARFKQSLKPEGIDVPVYFQERELAEYYLRLIQKAKSK